MAIEHIDDYARRQGAGQAEMGTEFPGELDASMNDPINNMLATGQRLASRFYRDGMDSYSERLIGEDTAKRMYLAALAMGAEGGMAAIVIGAPGGGKSLLTEYGYSIVDGLDREDVAYVPHRQDLTPAKLTGDVSQLEKTTYDADDNASTEVLEGRVLPILRVGKRIVQFDEVNRTSPLAMNAALKIMQDGKIETVSANGELEEVSDIDLVSLAMNNYGTLYTNDIDPAVVGRTGMGSFMNERPRGHLGLGAVSRWSNPDRPFRNEKFAATSTDLNALHAIRRAIPFVQMQKPEQEMGMSLEAAALDYLSDNGMEFADARPADQLVRISQTLALMDNQPKVTEDSIVEAFKYWMVPRLGMKGKISTNAEAEQIVEDLVENI